MKSKATIRNCVSDFLDWLEANNLIEELIKTDKYKMAALIAIGINVGCRICDLKNFNWEDLEESEIRIKETKTGKIRTITFSDELKEIINRIKVDRNFTGKILVNKKGKSVSTVYLNTELKRLKIKYNLSLTNISSHSLRKSFGRRFYEVNGRSEHSLIVLSEIFGHSSIEITRIYLGLKKEEIANAYLSLYKSAV